MRELERLILVINLAAVAAVAMTATPLARLSSVTALPRQGRVGQPGALGAIIGRITDERRSPIQGAEIVVREIARSVMSNDSGRFAIVDVPAGSYHIVVRHVGYESATMQAELAADDTLVINNIRLSSSPTQLSAVEVSERAMTNPTRIDFERRCIAAKRRRD